MRQDGDQGRGVRKEAVATSEVAGGRCQSRLLCLLLYLSVLLIIGPISFGQTDISHSGVIRLIHIGKAWIRPYYPAPVWVSDPRISYYPVPSHAWSIGEEAFRNLRLYLPRTEEKLAEFDIIVEDGMDAKDLPTNFHHWMARAVQEYGLGLLMADDSSSFATSGRHTSWYMYPIGEVLPVEDVPEIFYPEHSFHIVVEERYREHPLMRNIPWGEVRVWAHNRPTEKQGATVLARMSPELPCNRNKPVLVYWDYGEGRAMAYVHKWSAAPCAPGDIAGSVDFYKWKWHFDVLCHLVYFTSKSSIPEDLALVHSIRVLFDSYHYRRAYLISSMDFADKFGANLAPIEKKLGEVVQLKRQTDLEYISMDLDNCHSHLCTLVDRLDELTAEVLRAKDRAVLWIFIAEWLTVAGTSMITGFVLWTLMVRRRLYREAGITRWQG